MAGLARIGPEFQGSRPVGNRELLRGFLIPKNRPVQVQASLSVPDHLAPVQIPAATVAHKRPATSFGVACPAGVLARLGDSAPGATEESPGGMAPAGGPASESLERKKVHSAGFQSAPGQELPGGQVKGRESRPWINSLGKGCLPRFRPRLRRDPRPRQSRRRPKTDAHRRPR